MKREIKFRGQTRRKGERIINMAGDKCDAKWVYGGVFPQNNGGDFAIIYEQPSCEKRVVYADTVGQYIGVKDKNGKEIYEGDIVSGLFNGKQITGFIRYGSNAGYYIEREGLYGILLDNAQDWLEVIGNIFDNPELLEGD